jgi:tyrosyl-DNA phosphodiesterase-1
LSKDANEEEDEADIYQADRRKLIHESLTRPVSPPPLSRTKPTVSAPKVIRSPFQLTSIRDLPPASNVDAVTLKDILGDPLISKCWEFNYLHDLDFLMNAFDEDIRAMVRVHVVHGFWKNEDESRLRLLV